MFEYLKWWIYWYPHRVIFWIFIILIVFIASNYILKEAKLSNDKVRNCVIIFFPSYLVTLFVGTIGLRGVGESYNYNFSFFWSLRAALNGDYKVFYQVIENIIIFIPIGMSFFVLFSKKVFSALLVSTLISLIVEVAQLVTYRGLCEFDDVIFNSLGAIIGIKIATNFYRNSHKRQADSED